jgi:hypothetical protein
MSVITPEVDGATRLINGWSGGDLSSFNTKEAKPDEAEDDHSQLERPQPLTFKSGAISPKVADLLGISTPDRPNMENNCFVQLSESVNAKTVGRLKIHPTKKWKGMWNESIRGGRASMESLHQDISESISPKVAERLGIAPVDRRSWGSQRSEGSQSSETKRTDRSFSDPDMIPNGLKAADSFGINPLLGVAQSPGLILWPSTFIPVEPLELEMHACKHMHALLGCKAALSDFIQDIKGPDGQAHISQDELNDLTWEYEW